MCSVPFLRRRKSVVETSRAPGARGRDLGTGIAWVRTFLRLRVRPGRARRVANGRRRNRRPDRLGPHRRMDGLLGIPERAAAPARVFDIHAPRRARAGPLRWCSCLGLVARSASAPPRGDLPRGARAATECAFDRAVPRGWTGGLPREEEDIAKGLLQQARRTGSADARVAVHSTRPAISGPVVMRRALEQIAKRGGARAEHARQAGESHLREFAGTAHREGARRRPTGPRDDRPRLPMGPCPEHGERFARCVHEERRRKTLPPEGLAKAKDHACRPTRAQPGQRDRFAAIAPKRRIELNPANDRQRERHDGTPASDEGRRRHPVCRHRPYLDAIGPPAHRLHDSPQPQDAVRERCGEPLRQSTVSTLHSPRSFQTRAEGQGARRKVGPRGSLEVLDELACQRATGLLKSGRVERLDERSVRSILHGSRRGFDRPFDDGIEVRAIDEPAIEPPSHPRSGLHQLHVRRGRERSGFGSASMHELRAELERLGALSSRQRALHRPRAPSHTPARLEHACLDPARAEGAGRGEPRHSCAEDHDVALCIADRYLGRLPRGRRAHHSPWGEQSSRRRRARP